MKVKEETVWLIMSKDREFVAKGTPRNRELVRMDDENDKKRFLTYSSKGKAEAGFKSSGFYGQVNLTVDKADKDLWWSDGKRLREKYLEAVECKLRIELVS